ncbi:MAG: tRNA pseudouridine(38-40) synthase TruA [Lachnospiraceae bacterium]
MNSYKCIVAYEGTRYNGWQKQGNTENTIQEKIQNTISRLINEEIEITASGRTDAGVHAKGQVFHFHCQQNLSTDDFLSNINRFLPKDIRILSAEACDNRFHARLNATRKTYCYYIDTSQQGNLFLRNTSHHIPTKMDLDAMKKAAGYLVGTHDFLSFCSNKKSKKSSVRTIYKIHINYHPEEEVLTLSYTGNGFLYNMVRILTGTLIEIGLGIRKPEDIPSILEGKNRGLAGHTAPAKGLFLLSVSYE